MMHLQARRRVYVYRAPKLQPGSHQQGPAAPQQGAVKGKRKQAADGGAAGTAAAAEAAAADPDAPLRAQLTAVLEEPPKWALLTDVLLVGIWCACWPDPCLLARPLPAGQTLCVEVPAAGTSMRLCC